MCKGPPEASRGAPTPVVTLPSKPAPPAATPESEPKSERKKVRFDAETKDDSNEEE